MLLYYFRYSPGQCEEDEILWFRNKDVRDKHDKQQTWAPKREVGQVECLFDDKNHHYYPMKTAFHIDCVYVSETPQEVSSRQIKENFNKLETIKSKLTQEELELLRKYL